jgi:hypothetical protein
MFTAKLAAGALAIALLAMSAPSASSAAPGIAPQPATTTANKASGITLVQSGGMYTQGPGGGATFGGGNRGSSSGGNGGFSSGGNRGFNQQGPSSRSGRGNRGFSSGGNSGFYTQGPGYDRGHRHHRHGHRHHRSRGVVVYGAAPYADDYYANDDCEDLYERAVATDSRYWWYRYYECRDGD